MITTLPFWRPWRAALGKGIKAKDSLLAGLTDSYTKLPMGLTAEKLGAEKVYCTIHTYTVYRRATVSSKFVFCKQCY